MDNQSFEYTYNAAQQQEIKDIRSKYLPREEDKMERLRKLHNSATQKAQSASIAVGVIGALLLGTGMSLCMTELGAALGLLSLILGVAVGLVGILLVALGYPVYNRILTRERRRIAPEVLRLSEELLDGSSPSQKNR